MNLADLKSSSFDAIDDLPEFAVPPNGHYQLCLDMKEKEVNGKECIEASFTVEDVLGLENPNAVPPKVGDKFSCLYQVDNEFGAGLLKKLLKPIFEASGASNYGAAMEAANGMTIAATVKQRFDKDDKTKVYARVENVTVL
jgi:hypothetical protein